MLRNTRKPSPSRNGLRWLRLPVVILDLVGMLFQFERVRTGLCQGFWAEAHVFDQVKALFLLFLWPPPADSNIAHPGRVVLELVGPRLVPLELFDHEHL